MADASAAAKSVRSHFGFEPQGGVSRQRTRASRLLFDLIRDADMEAASSSADIYMQFAVYDLVGALFAPTDPRPVSRSADKLFARICGVVRDGLLDPDFGPAEGGQPSGDFAAIRPEAFHRAQHDMQRIHLFASPGPCRTSSPPPGN